MTLKTFNIIKNSIPTQKIPSNFIFTEEIRDNDKWHYYMADGGYTEVLIDKNNHIQYFLNGNTNKITKNKF